MPSSSAGLARNQTPSAFSTESSAASHWGAFVSYLQVLESRSFWACYASEPPLYLIPEDYYLGSRSNPTWPCAHFKCFKTDPFWQDCYICLGLGSSSMCPVSANFSTFTQHGSSMGPFLQHQDGSLLTRLYLCSFLKSTLLTTGLSGSLSGPGAHH